MCPMAELHHEAPTAEIPTAGLRLQCVQVQIVTGRASEHLLQFQRKNVVQSERDKREGGREGGIPKMIQLLLLNSPLR